MGSGLPRSQLKVAWLALSLAVALTVGGIWANGLGAVLDVRFWNDLVSRADGPLHFRLFLQPCMAAMAAFSDGIREMRSEGEQKRRGWAPFLASCFVGSARIILLGLVMDLAYQWIASERFYTGEAVVIALLVAFLPYVLLRVIIACFARR